ncbi:radical SAM protein [Leisingera sp. XS_AS12]|uniref:radical SAM protein n=1 Tax=Leisingera sp. XS_AS12 TaxID=3241294 RepID=UPI0035155E0D
MPNSSTWQQHASCQDASVNWSRATPDGGLHECRYVRRSPEYFIAYLSSHSGCRHACRFCHLTQTGQTMFTPARIEELQEQLDQVLAHYDAHGEPAGRINVNFMARGEPLSNYGLMSRFADFSRYAKNAAGARDLELKINISTIMPTDAHDADLAAAFGDAPVVLYWSLYSLDPAFRRRWLPRAMDPQAALERLLDWQKRAGGRVVLHWALIEGENDQDETFEQISDFVSASGLDAKLNLVRYNPYSPRTGAEAGEERYAAALKRIGGRMAVAGSKVVSRVGYDVKASCGMFLGGST